MPILEREASKLPNNLFETGYQKSQQEAGSRWWAVYTMSRKEKEFMRQLAARDIPFYCPIYTKQYRSPQGRLRTSCLPLFSNYVFLFANEEQRAQTFLTNCISRFVEVNEPERLVKDLTNLDRLLEAEKPVTPEKKLLQGDMVRVKSGTMAGVEGVVFRRQNQTRLLVYVDFMGAGTSLEVDEWELEKVY